MKPTKALAESSPSSLSKLAEKICEGDLPSSSSVITAILELRPEDEFSIQELASLILKDYGLTTRVIRMANTCYFNPSNQEITTVSRAIVMLGVEFIREMALASTLFEVILQRTPPSQTKQILSYLGHSYLCAFLAKQVAHHLAYDDEEIFIYGLFHRIVRILLAISSPKILQEWEKKEEDRPELIKRRLYRLAEKVAVCWSFPGKLLDMLEGSPKTREEGSLASWIDRLDAGVNEYLKTGDQTKLKEFFQETGLKEADLEEFLGKSQRAIQELWPPMAKVLKPAEEGRISISPSKESEPSPEDFYYKALREITAALASPRFDYQEILLMVMETICRAFECQNVCLGILSLDRQQISIKYGVGHQIKILKGTSIPVDQFFGNIFSKGVEWSGKVENLPMPNELVRHWPGYDVLISPLSIEGRGLGAILALRKRPFTIKEKQQTETLRHLAVLAIKYQKRPSRPNA